MKTNKNGPLFISCPTYRNYSEYHDAEQYYKGWNDAMRYIFGECKEEKEGKISLVRRKEGEQDDDE